MVRNAPDPRGGPLERACDSGGSRIRRASGAGPMTGTNGLTALPGGTRVDVTSGAQYPNTTILIDSERIVEVRRSDGTAVPPGARVIDVSGTWVLPGLIEMHAHVTG